MKFKSFKYALPLLALIAVFAFSAWDNTDRELIQDPETGEFYEQLFAPNPTAGLLPVGGVIDTLTGSTGKTYQVPYIFASAYQYEIYMRIKKISGTPNSKVVLDSRTVTNGTWTPIDSVSVAGADSTKLHFRFRGTNAYGNQYRYRLVKTGASSLSFKSEYNFKPTK